ncbi:MAG: capsular biosynthesis protein [Halothiobacillaceae bacterium]|nr:capsular biosynthesis protein [Halothiobacillaceae bacterium]
MNARHFLFLQGPATPFFYRLSLKLIELGHRASKVQFNVGDTVYWRAKTAYRFNAEIEELPHWCEALFDRADVTDIVLFGDRRPVHRPFIEQAKLRGIFVHVFEEGYFRPHWITLEREGVNGHSQLPRNAAWYLKAANQVDVMPARTPFKMPFSQRALHDVLYHAAGLLNPVLFPHYKTHALYTAPKEYANYLWRMLKLKRRLPKDTARLFRVLQTGQPFFFLPLQLDGDAQLRDHSNFDGVGGLLKTVLASFAQHAPEKALLLVKNHPLDPGAVSHEQACTRLAREFEIAHRVWFFEGGDLETMVRCARGVVVANSTVGTLALERGTPLAVLATSIYALEGLVNCAQLDTFWGNPVRPDAELFTAFRSVALATTQVNGGFYCETGMTMAIEGAVPRLLATHSPLELLKHDH